MSARLKTPGFRVAPLAWAVVLCLLTNGVFAKTAFEDCMRRGRSAFEDGLFRLAEEQFREALKERDLSTAERTDATVMQVRAMHQQARHEELLEALKPRGPLLRRMDDTAPFTFWRAMALFRLSRPDEALAELSGFEEQHPDHAYTGKVVRLRAQCFLAKGDRTGALAALEQFDKQFQSSPEAAANLTQWGRVLLAGDDAEAAAVVLRRAVSMAEAPGAMPDGRLLLGRALRRAGHPDEAFAVVSSLSTNAVLPGDKRAEVLFEKAQIEIALTHITAAVSSLTGGVSVAVSEDLQKRGQGRLGCLYLDQGDIEHGRPLVKAYVSAMPDDPQAGPSQLTLAEALLNAELYDEALAEFQNYLESFDDTRGQALAHAGKGWSLIGVGRFAEAATSFERAAEVATDDERREQYLFKVADAYFLNGQFKLALEGYGRVIEEYPAGATRSRARFQQGECHVKLEQWEEAEACFEDVRRQDAGTAQGEAALFRMAMIRESQGRWQQAIDIYDSTMAAYTNGQLFARSLHGRGMAHYRLYRFRKAAEDFERVVESYPESDVAEQAFYMRGMSYYGMMRDDLAVQVCTEFVDRFPESQWLPDVLFWLGRHEYNHASFADAEARFLSVPEADPTSSLADDALLWAGLSAFRQKEYLRSIETLSQLVKNYPESPRLAEARFHQGDALSELGRFSAAILTFDEILSEFPSSELVSLAWGRKGDCQFTLGAEDARRYEESIASYRVVSESSTARPDLVLQANYKIGRSLEKLARPDEALDQYYTNVILRYFEDRGKGIWHDQHAKVWFTRAVFNAADVMESRGDWRGVVSVLQKAVKAGVPAAAEAAERIKTIKSERWWLFY